jgi:hypothetical protein
MVSRLKSSVNNKQHLKIHPTTYLASIISWATEKNVSVEKLFYFFADSPMKQKRNNFMTLPVYIFVIAKLSRSLYKYQNFSV